MPKKALKRANIEHEVVAISENDKYASRAYELLHGPTNNLGDIRKIGRLLKADLWTYSFPCTDISLAGKMKGFDKGSNTHSSLLWEFVLRIWGKRRCSKTMGALDAGLKEDELQELVDTWRNANPHIVRFWWGVDRAMVRLNKLIFNYKGSIMYITLPSGRSMNDGQDVSNDVINHDNLSDEDKIIEAIRKSPNIKQTKLAEIIGKSNRTVARVIENYYKELISKHNDWELVDVYANYGISGTKVDRPEFNRMI